MNNWGIVALVLLWAVIARRNADIALTVVPPDEELAAAIFGG
jgi:hypothetical protein